MAIKLTVLSPLSERIEIRMTTEQRAKLERLAQWDGRTPSSLLRRWIDQQPEPELKK